MSNWTTSQQRRSERESQHDIVVERAEQARESATQIRAYVDRISDSVTRFKAAEKAKR